MARDFTDILSAVWAANALTTIPNPPIPGQAYRNTEIDDSNLENGQQYSEVYDSARYNQLLYLLSGCLKMLMETGLPEWSAEQNYQKGAYTVGSDGEIYGPAKKASGPDNGGAVDPVTDAAGDGTTWQRSLPKFAPQFGAYSKVVDGYVASAAVIDDTTSINNITTPGRYIIGTSVANTPVSLSAPSMLVVFGVTTNDGASFAASTLQILYAENPNDSTEVWTRAASAANTWGTWKRQDAGSLQPFVAPTASSSGKQGLVPAPEATPLQVQPLRVMGPNAAWNVLRQGSFDVSWDEADSKKIVLGAKYVQPYTSVDAIPYPGDFYCDAWNVPGLSGALTGLLIRRDPGTYGMEEEGVRSSFEILYDLSFDAIRFRKTTGGFAAGGAYTWTNWDTLVEKSSAPPLVPTPSGGVGQWIALHATQSGFSALPHGGTWACYFSGNGPLGGAAKSGGVAILPGGSTPNFGTYQWGAYNDVAPEAVLAWRIA